MGEFKNLIKIENLQKSKRYLVPHIFTENYYNILKLKIKGEKLSKNEVYYYNHFIKKKIKGIIVLMEIDNLTKGNEFIRKSRINKSEFLLKKYSRIHKGMKILISGSFLYSEKYNDIDVFIVSKYNKEDYRTGKVHVNYIPEGIENSLFFQSISAISISNFNFSNKVIEDFKISDILHLYEVVVLLILQKDNYLQELRDLIVRLEYISNKVVLNPMQLKIITEKIIRSRNPVSVINKYLIAKIINSHKLSVLKKTLKKFIAKNSVPEKRKYLYKNWKIYSQTYKEAIEIVT